MTGADAEAIRRALPELGEGLAAQLVDLSRAPTPERCERAAINLQGAAREVMRLRERLQAEGGGDGA